MILLELIIKIIQFGTDILLKMGFHENMLATEIFEMALESKLAAICEGSNNKLQILFSTEYNKIHDLVVYNTVFSYTRQSGVAKKYSRHFIVSKI